MEAPLLLPPRHELGAFLLALAVLDGGFFFESLHGGKILSAADVIYVGESFREFQGPLYEPANRLLMDPVLQFQPWLEFNRSMLRSGRLPLWNPWVGCGAPHLANGQSAVFDPFHLIAYFGSLPEAHAWMAAARLWFAGFGMFLLARTWGLGPWGRWFAGLLFPFCGFLVVWLLYPVTSVAIWMPWLFWTSERLLRRPCGATIAAVSICAGGALLGGHVQTSAHLFLAVGSYVIWRWANSRRGFEADPMARRGVIAWCGAVALGIALGAVQIIPLGFYLSRSPVWSDRAAERAPIGSLTRPRLLDAVCTAFPYAYGSQRRGQPNLAKAFGVHNLNESAGGFAGLATLLWLAPLAWSARGQRPIARFLGGLVVFGAMGAFEIPPVANLLRAIPVLDVTDNRRMSLWVAFGLVLLGGLGLDHLGRTASSKGWERWASCWIALALALVVAAVAVPRFAPQIRAKSLAQYARVAAATAGADAAIYQSRAEHQAERALSFLPRYALGQAGHLAILSALVWSIRRTNRGTSWHRGSLIAITLCDMIIFGYNLNPAIPRGDDRPASAVIAYLRREAAPPARVLAIGAELPPNTLMRYGLADCRNYDSIELARSLDWFEPLYERAADRSARTSRRSITWENAARSVERLRAAGVTAIVGAIAPPRGAFARVDRVGGVWIARLESSARTATRSPSGEFGIDLRGHRDNRIIVAETFDPGWRAEVDGRRVAVEPHGGTWLGITVAPGSKWLTLRYDPPEVRWAAGISVAASVMIGLALAARGPRTHVQKTTRGLGSRSAAALQSIS